MSKGGWKYSSPRLLKVADFPWCDNADIDWCVRIPIDPVHPNVEIPLELCEDEDAILWPTFLTTDNQQASLERKRDTVPPGLHI